MKPIGNWENVQAQKDFTELPAGAYICKIMGAEIKSYTSQSGDTFEKLEVSIDIAEGDFENYYADNYRSQSEPKKWKGVLRYYVPSEDGSEKDEWSKRVFKGFTEALESSNQAYRWEWDERTLKGKKIGVIFRREEWSYNGKTGWRTAPLRAIDTTDAATGNFRVPADKPLAKSVQSELPVPNNFVDVGDEEDLPF